jgi:phytoene synthase
MVFAIQILPMEKSPNADINFMMCFHLECRHLLYEESWADMKMLEREDQFAIGAAPTFYSVLLDNIEKHDYDVFSRGASLSAWGKVSRLPSLWLKIKSL